MLDIAKLEEEIKEEQSNSNKQPETMNELYILLQQLGKAWREENAYIVNEGQKNERTVTPCPSVAIVANVLKEYCYFTFIGEGTISDVSKLYIYHLDLGYYVSSDDVFRKLLLKYDNRLTSNKFFTELIADIPKAFVKEFSTQKQYMDLVNGCRIMYRPFDDPNKLRSYNLTMFLMVEASEIKPEAFVQLKTRLRHTDYPYRIEEELSKIGEDGWELVNVIKGDNDSNSLYELPETIYYFKKAIQEDNITITK